MRHTTPKGAKLCNSICGCIGTICLLRIISDSRIKCGRDSVGDFSGSINSYVGLLFGLSFPDFLNYIYPTSRCPPASWRALPVDMETVLIAPSTQCCMTASSNSNRMQPRRHSRQHRAKFCRYWPYIVK